MRERFSPIEKLTLQDRIYGKLKYALMRGGFAPGDVLVIRALAEEMGTSIMPVRDALHRLVAEQALRMLPNRSAEVPLTTRAQFMELTAIRLRLEALAAELAASQVDEEVISTVVMLNERMERAIADEETSIVLEANLEIHFNVYKMADADFLLRIIEALWLRIGPMLAMPFQERYRHNDVFAVGLTHHRALIKALRNRDPQAAGQALRADITEASAWYLEHHTIWDQHSISDAMALKATTAYHNLPSM